MDEAEAEPPGTKKSGLRRLLLLGAGLVVLGDGFYFGRDYWLVGRFHASTDDAYVQADTITIAPKVPGYLVQVLVGDNEPVKAGQVLARIDARDYTVALDQARADVGAATAAITSKQAAIEAQQSNAESAKATIAVDRSNQTFADQDSRRYAYLAQTGFGSVQNAQQAAARTAASLAGIQRDEAALAPAVTGSMRSRGRLMRLGSALGSRDAGGLVANLRWRVRLVTEAGLGVTTETELACIERDEQVGLAELGLRLDGAKQIAAALQARIVPAQMAALSEHARACMACGRRLAAKGHCGARFRCLFGDVPVQVRRWFVCPCRGESETKGVAALDFGGDALAPELAHVTARHAAMAPSGKVAALLSELLPVSGTQHASTVRNTTLRA